MRLTWKKCLLLLIALHCLAYASHGESVDVPYRQCVGGGASWRLTGREFSQGM